MYQKAILLAAICEVAVTAFWIWTVFRGGAEYIGPRAFVIPWTPRAVKVFSSIWLIAMTYLLLSIVFQFWPAG